jgi:hypothetical protein
MHWVVQENLRSENGYDDFLTALKELSVPHTVVKVDSCQFKPVEINCINACGFYDTDMRPVIRAVEALG